MDIKVTIDDLKKDDIFAELAKADKLAPLTISEEGGTEARFILDKKGAKTDEEYASDVLRQLFKALLKIASNQENRTKYYHDVNLVVMKDNSGIIEDLLKPMPKKLGEVK